MSYLSSHPYDIEELYVIKDKLNELTKDVNNYYIPRLTDLIHIINICESWCHDDNLKMLVDNRDELIKNIKEIIMKKLEEISLEINGFG